MTVRLERFAEQHLPLLADWLQKDHVTPWYRRPEEDLAFATSLPETGAHALITLESEPVGYVRWTHVDRSTLDELGFQHIPEGSVDIDILLGDAERTARGIGPQALELLVRRLSTEAVPLAALTTSVNNERAQRAFRKVGFEIELQYEAGAAGTCHLMTRDLRSKP